MKVLSSLIEEFSGMECATCLHEWHKAENLWQARASLVAFLKVTHDIKSYYPLIEESAAVLVRREERFSKTAVGWVLREVSHHDKPFVESFIEANLECFSIESLRNATKYFENSEKKRYLAARRDCLSKR